MSRVGKNPVVIPEGVNVAVTGRDITVKGKLGELSWSVPHEVNFEHTDGAIVFTPRISTKDARAKWGLCRALTQNMVTGVSQGFERKLEIHGVGYRSSVQGNILTLNVGYSHPVEIEMPAGITCSVEKNTEITLKGFDKQAVGQMAANIRAVRKPEPYKGKGIRYAGEHIILKEGKKK